MERLRTAGIVVGTVVGTWVIAALAAYELTAKSPSLLGSPLPAWWASERAERAVRWNPATGLAPVDRLVHEGQEAVRFYALLARPRPAVQER